MAGGSRTFPICDRATELMQSYGCSASPRSYEIWYTFVTGEKQDLNLDVKAIIDSNGKLNERDVDRLCEKFFGADLLSVEVDKAGAKMMLEIEQVMSFLDTALGTAARTDESLSAIASDLSAPSDGEGLRDVLQTLVVATREVASANRALENRLRDSRSEITNLREALDTVRQESLTDPLTGMANRKSFEETLDRTTEQAHRDGKFLALVVIDIDHFKRFNDTYGHLTGDQVLRLVSAAMREHVVPEATLARFGGEEFGMILPGFDIDQAVDCAEVVRRSVEARELLKRTTGESLGRVTISLGVATLRPGEVATALLERADHCMYRAKQTGRNRVVMDAAVSLPDAA